MDTNREHFWSALRKVLVDCRYPYRVKLLNGAEWTGWNYALLEPVEGYIEPVSYGPVLKRDVEAVEIDPVVREYRGRLVPDLVFNEIGIIQDSLDSSGIAYEVVDGYVRVRQQ